MNFQKKLINELKTIWINTLIKIYIKLIFNYLNNFLHKYPKNNIWIFHFFHKFIGLFTN